MTLFKHSCLLVGLMLMCSMHYNKAYAQDSLTTEFTFDEFLGLVKEFHPVVKQADLILTESQAKLMKARGYFDPKLTADFYNKNYHDKTYYSLFNGSFKVPLWYGVEVKAAFDKNKGDYLNPEHYIPEDGLTSIGISVPIGQGLWINKRMNEVKKGKLYVKLGQYERTLTVAQILYDASVAYIDWKQQYEKVKLYASFYQNAKDRQQWIIRSIDLGALPPIDSVESGITLKSRKLEWEQAQLKLTKSRLTLSNFLWTQNNIPIELNETMVPEKNLKSTILTSLDISPLANETNLSEHPKLNALQTKLSMKELDRKLKANSLLPKLRVNYNYISEPNYFNNFNWDDYKIGASLSIPIFLRKERAELRIAKAQLQDAQYGLTMQTRELKTKIETKYTELNSYQNQLNMNSELVGDYQQMLTAEIRLFEMGESSIFYINTRENKLVKAKVKQIELKNNYFIIAAQLYHILARL